MQVYPQCGELLSKGKQLSAKFLQLREVEESILMPRSKQQHVSLGDSNNAYSYSCLKTKHARGGSSSLVDDGGHVITDIEQIKNIVLDLEFYQDLLGSSTPRLVDPLLFEQGNRLTAEHSLSLLQIPSKEEVKAALWSIPEHKAPRPDAVIGDDVTDFFANGMLLKSVNSYFEFSARLAAHGRLWTEYILAYMQQGVAGSNNGTFMITPASNSRTKNGERRAQNPRFAKALFRREDRQPVPETVGKGRNSERSGGVASSLEEIDESKTIFRVRVRAAGVGECEVVVDQGIRSMGGRRCRWLMRFGGGSKRWCAQ
ncbi:hypothetical protein Cgig2_000961 [Carnegiea gigantea]|uniref:Uncharacterized protein n=1 Tax=Carnegiea gigantea TaxID=171969 RepID=A0A9Q1KJW5_9CARY|nr:hypothetical protein Cgig2_000961 [Carnegiea gigantea]